MSKSTKKKSSLDKIIIRSRASRSVFILLIFDFLTFTPVKSESRNVVTLIICTGSEKRPVSRCQCGTNLIRKTRRQEWFRHSYLLWLFWQLTNLTIWQFWPFFMTQFFFISVCETESPWINKDIYLVAHWVQCTVPFKGPEEEFGVGRNLGGGGKVGSRGVKSGPGAPVPERLATAPSRGRLPGGPVQGRLTAAPSRGRLPGGPVQGRLTAAPSRGGLPGGTVHGRLTAAPSRGGLLSSSVRGGLATAPVVSLGGNSKLASAGTRNIV